MPTLASLKATLTALVRNATWLICWKTSDRAKASGSPNTADPTSQPSSSTEAPGGRLRQASGRLTLSTRTTSGEEWPGWLTSSSADASLREAQTVGRTAGGSGTSHDCRMWKAGLTMLAQVAQGNRAHCESGCVMCGTRWYLVLRSHAEARN